MTAGGAGEVRGWRDRAKRKKDSWTWKGCGECWGEWGIRGLNGSGKIQ